MKTKDPKKQKAQVAALAALSVAMVGTFVYRMMTPTPAAARVIAGSTKQPPRLTARAAAAAAAVAAASSILPDAPPPESITRDPFVPAIVDTNGAPAPTRPAPPPSVSHRSEVATSSSPRGHAVPFAPMIPPLPTPRTSETVSNVLGSLPPPTPAAPVSGAAMASSGPNWTVTGVLGAGRDAIAVLRDGETRHFARPGDMVDSRYRIISIGRQAILLGHGSERVLLPLGGPRDKTPSKDTPAPTSAPAPRADATTPFDPASKPMGT